MLGINSIAVSCSQLHLIKIYRERLSVFPKTVIGSGGIWSSLHFFLINLCSSILYPSHFTLYRLTQFAVSSLQPIHDDLDLPIAAP